MPTWQGYTSPCGGLAFSGQRARCARLILTGVPEANTSLQGSSKTNMFTVRCFKPHTNLEMGFCFYVLNRGKNTGRPSYSPNPNCFVVSCNTREEREQLFWACKALHINRRFHPYLRGSVIEFIVIAEVLKKNTVLI